MIQICFHGNNSFVAILISQTISALLRFYNLLMFLEMYYHSHKRLKATSNLIQIISRYFTTAKCVLRVSNFFTYKEIFDNNSLKYIGFPWVLVFLRAQPRHKKAMRWRIVTYTPSQWCSYMSYVLVLGFWFIHARERLIPRWII